jgi:hypothetical protein
MALEDLQPGKFLTQAQVLFALGEISRSTLRRMIATRRFPQHRDGKWCEADVVVYRWRLIRGEFEDLAALAEVPDELEDVEREPPPPPRATKGRRKGGESAPTAEGE